MKVAVIDDSKFFLRIIKKLLLESGVREIFLFNSSKDLLETIHRISFDIIIIDYEMPDIDGITLFKKLKQIDPNIIYIMLTSSKDESLRKKALNEGMDEFINKGISKAEFEAKINMLRKIIDYKNKLQKELEYKDYQEKLTLAKQKKIVKNELFNFFEDDLFIENYCKSRDILNGDTIFSKRINNHQYLIAVIDAMGKGLNASLTSINAATFLEYDLNKAIYYNDFNFKRLIKDFFEYVKSILLESEILCAVIICINKDKLSIANFGMPPIYGEKKIFPNNRPININSKTFNILEKKLPNYLYIISDGLIESRTKEDMPYYVKFLSRVKKNVFIKEIIEDFKKNANQDDDISIVHIFKFINLENRLFELEKTITKEDSIIIDEILKNIFKITKSQKIIYIMQELLCNTLEHALKNLDKIKININIFYDKSLFLIDYKENSIGFDIEILNLLELEKYHGRGFRIIKKLSEGIFFNYKANEIKIFVKDEK